MNIYLVLSKFVGFKKIAVLLLVFNSTFCFSEPNRDDYDVDGDGLIEINDVEDFLALKSAWATGYIKLYGENTGCPEAGCIGFELEADLDLSSFANAGGRPSFSGQIFEGNNHTIGNTPATIPRVRNFGFFDQFRSGVIRNLNIVNFNIKSHDVWTGLIANHTFDTVIHNVRTSGLIQGYHFVGSLVGVANNTTIIDCHYSGTIDIEGRNYRIGTGGFVGYGNKVTVIASSSVGTVINTVPDKMAGYHLGAFFGDLSESNKVIASYSDFTVNTGVPFGVFGHYQSRLSIVDSYSIVRGSSNEADIAVIDVANSDVDKRQNTSLRNLSCPLSERNDNCVQSSLFAGWEEMKDSLGQAIWNFDNNAETPQVNSSLSFDYQDSDGDFSIDLFDQFPQNASASEDFDNDGEPDMWNEDCDQACQEASDLELDDNVIYGKSIGDDQQKLQVGAGALGDVYWFTCLLLFVLLHINNGIRTIKVNNCLSAANKR